MFKVLQWLLLLFWMKSKLFIIWPWGYYFSQISFLTNTKLSSHYPPPARLPQLFLLSLSFPFHLNLFLAQLNSSFKIQFQLSLQEVSIERRTMDQAPLAYLYRPWASCSLNLSIPIQKSGIIQYLLQNLVKRIIDNSCKILSTVPDLYQCYILGVKSQQLFNPIS